MARVRLSLVVFLLLAALPLRGGQGEEEEPINLPEAPKATVISLEYELGLAPPRKLAGPVLSVLADGTVLAPDVRHGHGTATISLSEGQLRELLRFVVREQRFMELDPGTIEKGVRAAAGDSDVPAPLDGATTVVAVRLADHSNTVRWYALADSAKRHPTAPELTRLAKVAHRLERLRLLTTAGGEKAVTRYLDLVNAALRKVHEEESPLTLADLRAAFLTEGGGRRVCFRRPRPDGTAISVTVIDPGDGEPEVSIG